MNDNSQGTRILAIGDRQKLKSLCDELANRISDMGFSPTFRETSLLIYETDRLARSLGFIQGPIIHSVGNRRGTNGSRMITRVATPDLLDIASLKRAADKVGGFDLDSWAKCAATSKIVHSVYSEGEELTSDEWRTTVSVLRAWVRYLTAQTAQELPVESGGLTPVPEADPSANTNQKTFPGNDDLQENTIELAGKPYRLTPRSYKIASAVLASPNWTLGFSDWQLTETGNDSFEDKDVVRWNKCRTEINKAIAESGYSFFVLTKEQRFGICKVFLKKS